jgi:hypothetical protein
VILTGVVIFTLASLASGLAQSEILLLGGRVGFAAVVPARHPDRAAPRRAGRGDRHRRHRLVHLRHAQRR